MRVIFLTPHLRISGGVKVICRFAHELAKLGIETAVLPRKEKHKDAEWVTYAPKFKKLSFNELDLDYVNSSTCVIHYQGSRIVEEFTIPEVLFLQGFVSEDSNVHVEQDKLTIDREPTLALTTAEWLSKIIKKQYNIQPVVVPPGVDEQFSPKGTPKSNILTIGSLYSKHRDKNFNFFVEIIEALYFNERIRARPVVLSSENISKIKVFDKLCNPYSILKLPPQALLPYIYSSCHLWISPSILEGFGLTTLEAMACGTPTLWYPSQGLAGHLRHGYNCIHIEKLKTAVNWIKKLIKNQDLYNSISKRGVHTAKSFTWERSAKSFAKALTDKFGN